MCPLDPLKNQNSSLGLYIDRVRSKTPYKTSTQTIFHFNIFNELDSDMLNPNHVTLKFKNKF